MYQVIIHDCVIPIAPAANMEHIVTWQDKCTAYVTLFGTPDTVWFSIPCKFKLHTALKVRLVGVSKQMKAYYVVNEMP